MSRNPHLLPAERRKRVQVQNCIEDKFLRQKLDSISKEKHYIDRELRRISLAKESLLESLDRFNSIPRSTHKRLSLPCLRDGPKKEHETTPICASIPPLEALPHQVLKNRQRASRRSCDQSVFQNRKDEQSIEGKYEQQRKVDRLQRAQGVSEFRAASPVTASLILSGKIDKNKTASERTTCTSRGNIAAKDTSSFTRGNRYSHKKWLESHKESSNGAILFAGWYACYKLKKQISSNWFDCYGNCHFAKCRWKEKKVKNTELRK